MAVLVDEDGFPPFLPNVYATVRYRDSGAALTTTEKVLRAIGMAYLWAHCREIDIHTALTSETFLCSGLMKPDTHLGENARQIEVSDDQTTPLLYS